MYVKDIMTKNVVSVSAKAAVSTALDLMQANNFHRIPVVDKDNKLIGLVTKKSIKTENQSSSLSIFELNYLLNKLQVADLMIKDVITILPDSLLEEAASIMMKNNIGCLPVVENEYVVGIITQRDIFKMFIDLLGYHQEGTRYEILVKEDKVGVLENIALCFKNANISVSNIAIYNTDRGIEVVVIANGSNSKECKTLLKEAGYNVTKVIQMKNNI